MYIYHGLYFILIADVRIRDLCHIQNLVYFRVSFVIASPAAWVMCLISSYISIKYYQFNLKVDVLISVRCYLGIIYVFFFCLY